MIHHKPPAHHNRPYKIAAQTVGLVACLFVLFFLGGTGLSRVLKPGQDPWKSFLPLLILAVLGYIITWYKELAGTLIMTAGGVILLIFFINNGDNRLALIYGLPFIVAGIAYGIHINKRNELRRHEEKSIS